MKKKILICFGTRPELIKLLPVILHLKSNKNYRVLLCNTAQHKGLMDPLIKFYKLKIDYNLNILRTNQSLASILSKISAKLDKILEKNKPHCVIVQGDTSTSFGCALISFYHKTKIFHIEAGLRTFNIFSPWPEEINRKFISGIADFNFAPTQTAKKNLILEGVPKSKILVTGNTVIDLLHITLKKIYSNSKLTNFYKSKYNFLNDQSFKILISVHRRENFGEGIKNIFLAINKISENQNIKIIYSIHPNPNVKKVEKKYLKIKTNILKINNLNYMNFIYLMSKSDLIMSDSGGIQEEAPSLGRPNLVLRNYTERPEAINKQSAILVGTNKKKILSEFSKIYKSKKIYKKMSKKRNIYGNGKAYEKIVNQINKIL